MADDKAKGQWFTKEFAPAAAGSNETTPLFPVSAGWRVTKANIRVTQAGGGTETVTLGDGVDPDGYVVSTSVTATGNETVGAGALLAVGSRGKLYSADDTVDVVYAQTAGTGSPRCRFSIYVEQDRIGSGMAL
jgi:hypothetical protein